MREAEVAVLDAVPGTFVDVKKPDSVIDVGDSGESLRLRRRTAGTTGASGGHWRR
jgi:hypothetical protein